MSPRSREEIDRYNERHSAPVVCSFCNKTSADVKKMIAGPNGVAVCNECVDVFNDILADGESPRVFASDAQEDVQREMVSFKCPSCGRRMGIDVSSLTRTRSD